MGNPLKAYHKMKDYKHIKGYYDIYYDRSSYICKKCEYLVSTPGAFYKCDRCKDTFCDDCVSQDFRDKEYIRCNHRYGRYRCDKYFCEKCKEKPNICVVCNLFACDEHCTSDLACKACIRKNTKN